MLYPYLLCTRIGGVTAVVLPFYPGIMLCIGALLAPCRGGRSVGITLATIYALKPSGAIRFQLIVVIYAQLSDIERMVRRFDLHLLLIDFLHDIPLALLLLHAQVSGFRPLFSAFSPCSLRGSCPRFCSAR